MGPGDGRRLRSCLWASGGWAQGAPWGGSPWDSSLGSLMWHPGVPSTAPWVGPGTQRVLEGGTLGGEGSWAGTLG